nr:immunoglobulin heavy chain junction region [Mus musculus]
CVSLQNWDGFFDYW